MTHNGIHIDPRFLADIESGIGPAASEDPRSAPILLNNYALLLRNWERQNEQLRSAGVEPNNFVNGGVVTYLTIILKRAWSLAARKYPDFMEREDGADMLRVLNKMFDVAIGAGGGAFFLEAQRNIYEAMVADLRERKVAMTNAVETCFDNSEIDRVTEETFRSKL